LLAAAHGKPVYVEKPMALTASEGAMMNAACAKAGVPIFIAYYRRCLPRFLKVAELLHGEAVLGTIRFVRTCLYRSLESRYQDPSKLPWNVQPEISGGGLFVDLGSHTLDILDFLLGPIKDVSGYASSQQHAYPAEDAVTASWVFENGILGSGVWNFAAHGRMDEVQIVGDKGTMTFATFGEGPISVLTREGDLREFSIKNPFHLQQPLITTVVEQLRGVGTCPSTGESALRTQRVIDAVLRGYNR
jgi:predicted dehydrogenase